MNYRTYQHEEFNICIFFKDNEIIINILDTHNIIYEDIITIKDLNKLCISNIIITDIENYYNFFINCFDNIDKYNIVMINKKNKFLRITITEKNNDIPNPIKNILWIKQRKNNYYINNINSSLYNKKDINNTIDNINNNYNDEELMDIVNENNYYKDKINNNDDGIIMNLIKEFINSFYNYF